MDEKVTTDDSSIDSAASALSAGLGAWLPIETAPKCSSTVILGFDPSWYDIAVPMFWNEQKQRWQFYQIDNEIRPSHWMLMPEAPNVK